MFDFKKLSKDDIVEEFLYTHKPMQELVINNNCFNWYNLPTIRQYKVVKSGEQFYHALEKTKIHKQNSNRNSVGIYQYFGYVDSLYALIYENAYFDYNLESVKNSNKSI